MAGKTAGIMIVGDEILKGHVKDTNSRFLCKRLRALGTQVKKISVVEDNIEDIAKTVKEFSKKFDFVISSGGIGPTHDDVTYKGIAAGFDEDVVCNKLLEAYWSKVTTPQSSHIMAMVPESAEICMKSVDAVVFTDNRGAEVKMLPIIHIKNVYVLPGIPYLLENTFKFLEKDLQSPGCAFYTGKINLLVDEDLILSALNKTVAEMKDCVFGSYPVVNANPRFKTYITIEAKTVDKVQAAEDYFKRLISPEWLFVDTQLPNMANPVYKFLQTSADSRLIATLNKSLKLVEDSLDKYSASGLMVSFNGGKDCTALLHLVLAAKQRKDISEPLQAVYFQPTTPFPEVEQFIQDTVSRLKIQLTTLPGSIKSALADLARLKPQVKAIFLGTRHSDPSSQNLSSCQMTDPDWPQFMRISPLLDWNYQDIWTLLRGISAPYCSLYDQGYTSLGSKDNTKPNPCLLFTDSDGTQRYRPAWFLTDESVERNGRL